ncbi:carbohydrate sulfotransferase 15 [Strongylocentrotus purpuratus]|uniref:Sulfotransferase domain-containing protein n=1 Tax=Strongylocentrotus purpuratus TaxID=7668 RepID=A0A7M7HR35_STRPU|nr:carbohydrate sulfotransferase 15 [Strongylocentrotus purpuratus]|eukprot:XP_011682709.1 PREDICTED: carbohydrate sulfotransferase 15-like [Strongylocentrotus purpuratus]
MTISDRTTKKVLQRVFLVACAIGLSLYIKSSSPGGSGLTTLHAGQPPPKVAVAITMRNAGIRARDHEQKQGTGNSPTLSVTKLKNSDDDIPGPGSEDQKKEKDQGREEGNDGKAEEKPTIILSSGLNLNNKSTTPPKLEVNYNVRFRQARPFNYSRLFSYDDEGKCQGVACKWPKMPGATKELVKWAPEIFAKVPQHFLDNFKNPCWVRDGAELNCLPYFYVIGMFKCGTTDIWSKIVDHPDVVDVPKEPHWWGPRRHGFKGTPINKDEVLKARKITGGVDDSSLEFYLNLYKSTGVPKLINTTATTRQGIPYHPKVFGDASISTAYAIGQGWTKTYPNASEPLFTNADLIRAVQPNAKIILMVRDPTVRANSWYWYSGHRRNNDTQFHNFVVKQIGCLKDCIKKHNIRYCAYASTCPYKLIPELQAGLYYVYARDWMNAFSRDGVLVIRLEDWQADPLRVHRQLFNFLDLEQLSEKEEEKILQEARKNKSINKRKLLPQTKKILDDFYRPYNKKMVLLMGDDKFLYPSN